jgi:hypothetical protein
MATLTSLNRLARLRSTQGTDILITYRTTFDANDYYITVTDIDFTVTVYNNVLESTPVSIALINNYYIDYVTFKNAESLTLPLTFQSFATDPTGYNFTGSIPNTYAVKAPYSTGHVLVDLPQIAACDNNVWQVDPIQRGIEHNFNFVWEYY